jgi:PAS domain S-box-containing protein
MPVTARHRPVPWFLRLPRWRLALTAFGLLYVAVDFAAVHAGQSAFLRFIDYLGFLPLQAGSAAALLLAARRAELPEGCRRGLRIMAGAFVGVALATIALDTIAATTSPVPPYTWVDPLYLLYFPLVALGALALPQAPRRRYNWLRVSLDTAVTLGGAGVLIWFLVNLHPPGAPGIQVGAYAYPLAALFGLVSVNAALTRGLPIPTRLAFLLLVGGLSLSMVSDFVYQLLIAAGYTGYNWSVPASVATNLAVLWGAWRYQTDPIRTPRQMMRQGALFSPLPILVVTGVALMLLWVSGRGVTGVVEPLLVSLVILNLLLILREVLALVDTARTLADEAARESRTRYEAFVRHSSDLVLAVDPSHRVIYASPASTAALGIEADQLIGRDVLELLHPEDTTQATAFLDDLLLTPGGSSTVPWQLRHAGGGWRRFEIAGSNLVQEPAVQGIVLNARDVSEREVLEERLRQAQKMEAVGRLAGGVAHDFNNLLTAVLAGSELALAEIEEGHPAREDLEEIRKAAVRGAALTHRLLAFSRREAPTPQVLRLGDVVASATRMLERLIGERIRLTTAIDPLAGHTRVDPSDVEQALLNLAANARDAMPEGGTLTLAVRDEDLAEPMTSPFLTAPAGPYVVLEVEDTGTGMDEATRARIFEPFFSTKARGEGTGLGLAGVYGMVKRAGGGITVESLPGKGTRIRMLLPRVVAEPARDSERRGPRDRTPGWETILLVEDDTAVRSATNRILLAAGYTVLTARDAAEAKRVMRDHPGKVHLLLSDVIMPGESGPSLAAELVGDQPGLRVLFMSGYTGDELRGHNVDRQALLRKPFTVEQLTAKVHEMLAPWYPTAAESP